MDALSTLFSTCDIVVHVPIRGLSRHPAVLKQKFAVNTQTRIIHMIPLLRGRFQPPVSLHPGFTERRSRENRTQLRYPPPPHTHARRKGSVPEVGMRYRNAFQDGKL